MINKKYNKKIKRCKCFECGSNLIVCNHGKDWWIACDLDRKHIEQRRFNSPEDAILYALSISF